jgi:hypothetical protein
VFRRVLGRAARADELDVARAAYLAELAELGASPEASRLLAIGESPYDADGDAAAQAALTMVARAVLTSTEAINRE